MVKKITSIFGIKEKDIMDKLIAIWFLVIITPPMMAQDLTFEKVALSDSTALSKSMQNLASDYLHLNKTGDLQIDAKDRFMIEILAGDVEASIQTMQSLRKKTTLNLGHPAYMPYELFSKAKSRQLATGDAFSAAYAFVFKEYIANCTDEQAYSANIVFTTYDAVSQFTNDFQEHYGNISDQAIPYDKALGLLKSYFLYQVFTLTEPLVFKELTLDENRRYVIKEEVIVSARDGAELSVITVHRRDAAPMPAVLVFTIYADRSNVNDALLAASKGYAGVVATSRGKRLSKDAIEPYKHEYKDVYAVIDWISHQDWNNGKVGMYGGSYNGFSQWASMKEKVHPALKTIIPSVSAAPGIDVPMANNIFFNFPYKWIPYVTNDAYLDYAANNDRERWDHLENNWFYSGAAYHKMDSIDGRPNPLFQEWISHPSYDAYWQNMIPYQDEFSHINIPILSTTGYYDDGQRGAMYYYMEHLKYQPEAEHYLLIGPYDHWGAQFASANYLRGYQIDEVAKINVRNDLVFDWLDYILKGKEKPAILKNKVNFEVMGANQWLNQPSLSAMSNDSLVFYPGKKKWDHHYPLVTKPKVGHSIHLSIDLADRTKMNNEDYYPWPIIKDSINLEDGLVFISKAIEKETIMSGSFAGDLYININKKDVDFAVNLYELTADGKYFHLSNYIGRASYAKSREERALLTPKKWTHLRFDNTSIICKKMAKDSRIVVVINANKNPFGQINYGTGREVSSESILDAKMPLKIKLHTKSKIMLPIWRDQ